MKHNNKHIKLAAVAVMSLILLAGCTELPGKQAAKNDVEHNVSEGVQQNLGDAIKQELGKAAAGIEQAVEDTAAKVVDEVKADGISKEYSTTQKVGSSSVLSIENSVGEIEVTTVAGDHINVSATILAHNSSNHASDLQEILDNAEISIKINGDKLKVFTTSKMSPKKDLWNWAQDKYGFSDFSISYVIEVPNSIEMFQITNNVGQIYLHDLKGTYRVVSNVGAIRIEGAQIIGKSTVESNTGSIRLDIDEMESGSSLKAKTDVGSLSAVLDDDVKCSLEATSELGHISGVTNGKADFNGGGPLISLTSQIGAITVQ